MKVARRLRGSQQPQSLLDYVRQFLTPPVWKQARQATSRRRSLPRWDLQPLVLIVMAMTWAAGDSQAEKFATARGFYVACYRARKRPGATLQGFQKALARVPLRQFQARRSVRVGDPRPLGHTVGRQRLRADGVRWLSDRVPPHRGAGAATGEGRQERRGPHHLGHSVRAPGDRLVVRATGPGTAAEQEHLRRLLGTLSPRALIVCGRRGTWATSWSEPSSRPDGRSCSGCRRRSISHPGASDASRWSEGPVLYWPEYAQRQGHAPLRCRLIRVPARGRVKKDVWLLTDVLDPTRLSLKTAAQFYRWRWRNEGLFRIYKRTINKLKLSSRTVRLAHREAEVSLLATQILLAHADLALRSPAPATAGEPVISPRKVLIEIRTELKEAENRRVASYRRRLKGCRAAARQQTSPKAIRDWPRRKPHKPPRPPILHTLTKEQKTLLEQHMGAVG